MAVEWQSSGSRVAIVFCRPLWLGSTMFATGVQLAMSNRTGLHWTASPPRRDSKVTRFSFPGPGNLNQSDFHTPDPPGARQYN